MSRTSSNERWARNSAIPSSGGTTRQAADVERRRDSRRDELTVADRGELDEGTALGVRALDLASELERQPCLAGSPRAGQREQARSPDQRQQLAQLVIAPDERARLRRQARRLPTLRRAAPRLRLELGAQLLDLIASLTSPVLVAILRQQLASVERQRRAVSTGRSRAAGLLPRALEVVHVDARPQRQQLLAQLDRLSSQSAPRDVHHLVQVVRRRRRVELRPERVHQLLAMQAMGRRQREQLDQLASLSQAPDRRVDRLAGACRREPTEELYRDIARLVQTIIGYGLQASTPGSSVRA